MADNTDFTKKILIDVEVKSEQIKKDIPILTNAIDELTESTKELKKEQADLAKAGQTTGEKFISNSKAIVENSQQLRQLKAEVREANKYIDNTAKAINAETGSIQQNRAVLSLVTSDYVKLGQTEGKTDTATVKLATDINTLTDKLKTQEKQIGQTYRNVGNYEQAINNVVQSVGSAIPGFQQFNQAIQIATSVGGFLPSAMSKAGDAIAKTGQQFSNFVGFKQFGKEAEAAVVPIQSLGTTAATTAEEAATAGTAAEGAAGGFTVMGAAATAAIGVIAGVAAAIYGLIQYLKTLDSLGDGTAQLWAGIKASFYGAAESIRAGDWAGLAHNMSEADKNARSLTGAMQDLGDAMVAQEVHNAAVEEQINTLMLKMRNKRVTPAEEKEYFDQIQQLSTNNYNERKKNADLLYNLAVKEAINGTYLSQQEKARLQKDGVDYAIILENNNKIAVGSYKKIADAQKQQIAAEQFNDSIRERSQNRLDAKEQQQQQKDAAADQKRLQQAQKESAALVDAENIRKASANRVLQSIYEEYGDRVVAADQSYNNELAKLKSFLAKKLITQAEYNSVEKQLTTEHHATISKIIDDYRKQDAEKERQAINELKELKISNIQDDTKRGIAELNQRAVEENQILDNQNKQHEELRRQAEKERDDFNKKGRVKEAAEAEERRLNELTQIGINEQKRIELAAHTASEIAKINKAAADSVTKLHDGNNVTDATNKFGAGSNQELDAKKQQLQDNYLAEISNEGLSAAAKLEINRKYLNDLDALEQQHRNQKIEQAVQIEQVIQGAAFDILSQGQQAASEKRLKDLDDQKTAELENTSLTNTQKKLIEQKYKKAEDAEKLRAFKANQKLQAANALINGAVAIGKTFAEMGYLPALPFVALTAASTAASIAKILSAKPGFATGGVFKSDGRGALLSGYSKHDDTNATLRSGEAVVVSEAMRNPWARGVVSRINEAFGGRSFANSTGNAFATGGIFTDGGNANRYYAQPVYDAEGLANSLAYQLINNFPPIYTQVRDVITQVGIVAKTEDRVNL